MCCEIAKISHGNEVANCAEKSVGKTNNNVLFVKHAYSLIPSLAAWNKDMKQC